MNSDKGIPIKTYIFNKKEAYEKILREGGGDARKDEVEAAIAAIQADLQGMLERRKKLDGVGILYMQYSNFGIQLSEAISAYELGYYNATIALCGTIAERICYDFIDGMVMMIWLQEVSPTTKALLYDMPFRQLLEFLSQLKAFDEKDKNDLHEIYNIRNQYVHPKKMGNAEDAIIVLNKLSRVLRNLFDIFKFYDLKDGKFVVKEEWRLRLDDESSNTS